MTTPPQRAASVSEVVRLARERLEGGLADLWIQGEISNWKTAPSGHAYFALKDSAAQIRAVLWRGRREALRFRPEDGLEVLARGTVTVYEPRGEMQLAVLDLEPLGAGALALFVARLKARLEAEGLFDPARKRPLPLLPRRIGVVTSPTGAALQDILRVLERRRAAPSVLLAPAPVQGEGAALELRRQLERLARVPDVDVIIIGRGGGSAEDLHAFNDEGLARAIAACSVPVVSAIGHETDFTIADFVADLRAPTPSAAAEMVVAGSAEMRQRIDALGRRLLAAIRLDLGRRRAALDRLALGRALAAAGEAPLRLSQRLDDLEQRLERVMRRRRERSREAVERLRARLLATSPALAVARRRARVQAAEAALAHAATAALTHARDRLAGLAGALAALSPLRVLARGYAIARREDGTLLRRAAQAALGERILVTLAEGELRCRVEE